MQVLTILSQKGGAGKTTLAVHLAVAAELAGKTAAIIDLDPQGSASDWFESREAPNPEVLMVQPKQLDKIIEAARKAGTELLIVDTAPHSESSALEAARMADCVLVPCRPAIFDIRAIKMSRDLALIAQKPYAVVLNATPSHPALTEEAREGIAALDMPLAPCELGMRQAFVRSLTEGKTAQEIEPKGKAAQEINALYDWLTLNLMNKKG